MQSVNRADQGLILRLDAVSTRLDSFQQQTGPTVQRLLSADQLDKDDLRTVSRELISLGGEFTNLGVDLALRAKQPSSLPQGGEQ